jgi:hypothetical protein
MINTSIWDDDYFADLDEKGKLAWMYILTNPVSELKPFYKLPSKRMSDFRLGFSFEFYLKKFENDGKIKVKDDWIYLINWMKHQRLNDNQMKGVENDFKELDPNIREFFQNSKPSDPQKDQIQASEILPNPSEPFEALPNGSEPLLNPSDKLTQPKLTQAKLTQVADATAPPREVLNFIQFWETYPKREKMEYAQREYSRLIRNGEATHQQIMQGLQNQLESLKSSEYKFIKLPENWLKSKSYLDQKPPDTPQGQGEGKTPLWHLPASVMSQEKSESTEDFEIRCRDFEDQNMRHTQRFYSSGMAKTGWSDAFKPQY